MGNRKLSDDIGIPRLTALSAGDLMYVAAANGLSYMQRKATLGTLRADVQAYVKPRDIYADGIHDDSGAINAAIVEAVERKLPVILPPGVIRLESSLLVPTNVTLEGSGLNTTQLNANLSVPAIQLVSDVDWVEAIRVTNMSILGGTHAIACLDKDVVRCSFERLECKYHVTACIEFRRSLYTNLFLDCFLMNAPYGLWLHEVADPEEYYSNVNTFIHCAFKVCSEAGLWARNLQFATFISCLFESNQKHGIYLEHCQHLIFQTPYFEDNGKNEVGGPYADVYMHAGSYFITFNSPWPGPAGANQGTPPLFIQAVAPGRLTVTDFNAAYGRAIRFPGGSVITANGNYSNYPWTEVP